jgi:hypothetical protein
VTFPCDLWIGGEMPPQQTVADPIGEAIVGAVGSLPTEPWRLVACALLAYAGTAAVKQILKSLPVNERHGALDWLARAGTSLWGALGGWLLLAPLALGERLAVGAVAGLFAVPLYHVARRLLGQRVADLGRAAGVGAAPPEGGEDESR